MPGLLKGALASRPTARLHAPGAADTCHAVKVRDPCGLGEGKQTNSLPESLVRQEPCAPQLRTALGASHAPALAVVTCQGHTLLECSWQTHPRKGELVVIYSSDQVLLGLIMGDSDCPDAIISMSEDLL